MSTPLPALLAVGFIGRIRQALVLCCRKNRSSNNVLLKTGRQYWYHIIKDQPHQLPRSPRNRKLELSWTCLQQWLHNHTVFGILWYLQCSWAYHIDLLMVRRGPDGSDLQTNQQSWSSWDKKKNTWKKHYVRIGLFWQFWITIELYSTFIKKDRTVCMCIDFKSQANNFANISATTEDKPANITILLVQQSDGQLGVWLAAFYFTKFLLTTL